MRGEETFRIRLKNKIAAILVGLIGLPAAGFAAVIGGTYYATQRI